MTDPQPSGGFEWAQAPWGRVLRCRALAAIADHFFTDGALQLRDRPDEWTAVAARAGVEPGRLLLLRQVHGGTVVSAEAHRRNAWPRPEADAVISDDPSSALVVRVADCAPVLLADRRRGVVAAVHAGWRSTVQRIAPAAIASMCARFHTDPADVVAAIGPSLGQCCGEMGEEVVEAFRASGHRESDIERWFDRAAGRRPHFDLWRANREQMAAAGVPDGQIFSAALCTRTHADRFHSYRAAGAHAGRMAAVIRPPNWTKARPV